MDAMFNYTSVKELAQYIHPVHVETHSLSVLNAFINDQALHVIPVLDDDDVPVGLVSRGMVIEFFSKPYTHELYGKRPISQFMNTSCVIIDQNKNIDDVARIVADSGERTSLDGFIITCEGIYVGIGIGRDLLNAITEQKNNHLYNLAHYDALTRLPSRLLFQDRLMQECSRVTRKNKGLLPVRATFALLFLDLDRFKLVNDTLGHQFGDLLLKEVSQRLIACVRRDEDTVARLGGDEFTIILSGTKDTKDVAHIAEKIIQEIGRPFQLCQHEVFIGVSIGIAIFPLDDTDMDQLIKKADMAMYHAKENGRNNYQFFTMEMNAVVSARISLENDLRHAIEKDEFFVHFQPIMNLRTGIIDGVETLIRWIKKGENIPPSEFIPLAEDTGLIVPIGEWVLKTACLQGKAWRDAGFPPIKIAVNLSIRQLQQDNFVDRINEILRDTSFDPAWLELELTESLVMKEIKKSTHTLEHLKALGISLSMDDFGTGYSSLSYLQRLPIDSIKIDRSFVSGIDMGGANLNIIRAIMGMAHGLGITVTAEGVETQNQLDFLRVQKCDRIQGYLFSRPLPVEKLSRILAEGRTVGVNA